MKKSVIIFILFSGVLFASQNCDLKIIQRSNRTDLISIMKRFEKNKLHRRSKKEIHNKVKFAQYKKAIIQSISEILFPAIEKNNLKYKEMLMKQHLIIRDLGYKGYYKRSFEHNFSGTIIREEFETWIRFEGVNLLEKSKLRDKFNKFTFNPLINDIPKSALPRNYGKEINSLFHHFPSSKDVQKYYLPLMKSRFNKLLNFNKLSDEVFLKQLSDYYHVSINSHYFSRINNSIFMSHVNMFLMLKGFKPLEHDYLDYFAFINSQGEFREIFKTYLIKSSTYE